MAAGLGFKDFTTGEVLTAADVDGYLMQGVWVFASAAARDAAVTSPQEGNFAYLKDTNVTTYYTGSAWANLDTTGMTNPMTTTGDMIYSSSGSTPARLGIGTANQQLRVNSGATAPEWFTPAAASSAMTKITASTFASSTSVTVDNCFTSTYANYVVYLTFTGDTSQCNIDLRMRASGSTDTAGYSTQAIWGNGSSAEAGEDLGGTGLMRIGAHLEYTNGTKIEFYQPQIAKSTSILAYSNSYLSSGGNSVYMTGGVHVDSTQFDGFELSFGNSQSGTVRVYGLEN
jgi:hypothetical protein